MENILVIILLFLNILDAITTYTALKIPGLAEGNPIMKFLMSKLGIIGALIASKGIVFAMFLYFLIANINITYFITIPLIIFYIVVVINNIKLIKKLT